MFKDNISRHLANVEPKFNDGIDRPSTSNRQLGDNVGGGYKFNY